MVDIVQCPGCCDGPCALTIISNDPPGEFVMPELMTTVSCSQSVILDRRSVPVDEYSGQRIALGDYGSYRDGNLIRMGNIFEDVRTLGIDLEDPAHRPVVSRVSSSEFLTLRGHMKNANDLLVIRQSSPITLLALHQPEVISLLANEHVLLLLNSVLSSRLAGKHVVITVIRCSDFYEVGRDSKRKNLRDDSTSGSGNHSTRRRNSTLLCTIVSPQTWKRQQPCAERREQFRNIRERFHALVNVVTFSIPCGVFYGTDHL
ncbi:hypothetical protein EV401DRAFT_1900374 [Pisolithus croceorrhizus]|nr:hypothetical protein EV401DRAFT_1900374 [Pisolithus croceorrhizus]